ncbi:protein MIZU-KUSSEI 1 [Diospyros lotus]|uniref:protein MIZU-KUSSEI 1 n=1 Tax=Diospyros lotus TaxID=55363 RepID=UPI00224C853B|nr:protein MIZU-KUSSEI 1 [Diospyros lotus]
MKAITAKTPHDSSFSFSRRYFHWKRKIEDGQGREEEEKEEEEEEEETSDLKMAAASLKADVRSECGPIVTSGIRTRKQQLGKFRSAALALFRRRPKPGLGSRVVGTLFGYRRGHVHFAFQEEPSSNPAFLVELSSPTSSLVREMASGLVRIALECDKKTESSNSKKGVKLLEEAVWRAYCNGKKCGFAARRECGPAEWKVLRAVGPVSMGAGVVPPSADGGGGGGGEGEVMYMRAKFERVVGNRDSEAFYMMNPDGHGGPELSIYLLRV